MKWYYVDQVKNERVGPVDETNVKELLDSGLLDELSYIWKKGLNDWIQLKDAEEFKSYLSAPEMAADNFKDDEVPQINTAKPSDDVPVGTYSFKTIGLESRAVHLKIGTDRGQKQGTEYGPFTFQELKNLFKENRINHETLFFVQGMPSWDYIANIVEFEELFGSKPPIIEGIEKRRSIRRPLVARMFFHDNKTLFEGICRDVSVGGMQVLVSNFPGSAGDTISINVHPENSDYNFVATGQVVRVLEGGVGFSFRFLDLNDEAKQSINKYISQE